MAKENIIEVDSEQFADYQTKKKEYVQATHDWETRFNNEFSLASIGLQEKWNTEWLAAKQNENVAIIHLDNNLSNNNFNNLEFVTESQFYILKELLSSPMWIAECKAATEEWLVEQSGHMIKQDAYYIPYQVNGCKDGLLEYYTKLFKRMQSALNGNLMSDSGYKKLWKQMTQKNGSKFRELVSNKKRKKAIGFSIK